MLRAFPPGASRRSSTTTANPRSANSWAAVIPAMPPPSTTTLAIAAPLPHLGNVDIALDAEVLHYHPPNPETLTAVEPFPVGVRGQERRRRIEGGCPRELAGRNLGVSVGANVEEPARPVEDERPIGRLVGNADIDQPDTVAANAHP